MVSTKQNSSFFLYPFMVQSINDEQPVWTRYLSYQRILISLLFIVFLLLYNAMSATFSFRKFKSIIPEQTETPVLLDNQHLAKNNPRFSLKLAWNLLIIFVCCSMQSDGSFLVNILKWSVKPSHLLKRNVHKLCDPVIAVKFNNIVRLFWHIKNFFISRMKK